MSPRATTAAVDPASTLDAIFFALADRTRRGVLTRLRHGADTAGGLAAGFHITRPAVSRHLRVLRQAALVTEERRGRERVYALAAGRLDLVSAWLDDYRVFWPARLHDLKAFVEAMPDESPGDDHERRIRAHDDHRSGSAARPRVPRPQRRR
jgi:DNA-binding transcriptional ArsR family regulator